MVRDISQPTERDLSDDNDEVRAISDDNDEVRALGVTFAFYPYTYPFYYPTGEVRDRGDPEVRDFSDPEA